MVLPSSVPHWLGPADSANAGQIPDALRPDAGIGRRQPHGVPADKESAGECQAGDFFLAGIWWAADFSGYLPLPARRGRAPHLGRVLDAALFLPIQLEGAEN